VSALIVYSADLSGISDQKRAANVRERLPV